MSRSFCVFSVTDALNCIIFLAYYEHTSREGQAAVLSCMPEYEELYTYTDYKAPMHVHIIVDNVTYTLASHYGCLQIQFNASVTEKTHKERDITVSLRLGKNTERA
jgi:galactose-1-phosphate uridylyltransferase